MDPRNFREVFTNKHAVLPVIHVGSTGQAITNSQICSDCGADGVFLIDGSGAHSLLNTAKVIHKALPDMWIGVNCLGLLAHEVMYYAPEFIGGIWSDHQIITEGRDEQPYAMRVAEYRKKLPWQGMFFGGTAFKYQTAVKDYGWAAAESAKYMEVPCTSGQGTGFAAPITKIKAMKDALGEHPLAIASGLTPENIAYYLDYADAFLVATGISSTYHFIDPNKLKQFVEIVRAGIGKEQPLVPENTNTEDYGFTGVYNSDLPKWWMDRVK